jgi:N-acetylglutamate synthase-like GNAT family acetyltransferase
MLNNQQARQIIDLILPIQRIEFQVPVTLEDQPDLLDIEKHYLETGGGFWGAFHDQELIGTIALISLGYHSGAIRKMFVKKEFRGNQKSIAQELFLALVNYCDAVRITDLYLGTTEVFKAAHRFYERNGFQRIPKQDLPHYFPVMAVDNVFYHLSLNRNQDEHH